MLVIALSLKAPAIWAQSVYNAGFEYLNPDGSVQHWGNVYLMPFHLDSTGGSLVDSIVFDNQFYAPATDAHTGALALELRNAWNYTTNTGIAGAVAADDDPVFSAWGLSNLVPTYATSANPFVPLNFGFYYKFFPVNGDSAFAEIDLWDSSGNQLAKGEIIITGAAGSYTLIDAPINYSVAGLASFYSLSIHNFYTAVPGSRQPGFGTRLLVDDVGFNHAVTGGLNPVDDDSGFQMYPNPATGQLNILTKENKSLTYKIYNTFGQLVSEGTVHSGKHAVKLDNFKNGAYHIVTNAGGVVKQHTFIVKK